MLWTLRFRLRNRLGSQGGDGTAGGPLPTCVLGGYRLGLNIGGLGLNIGGLGVCGLGLTNDGLGVCGLVGGFGGHGIGGCGLDVFGLRFDVVGIGCDGLGLDVVGFGGWGLGVDGLGTRTPPTRLALASSRLIVEIRAPVPSTALAGWRLAERFLLLVPLRQRADVSPVRGAEPSGRAHAPFLVGSFGRIG